MSSFEFNKIFAAVLVAGIVAMLASFISKQAVHPEHLINDAVAIDGAADSGDHGSSKTEDKGPEPILALLASADVEKGAKISKACAACHSFDKGGAAKQGPNLWGVVGRDIGSKEGFAYSEGMKNLEGNWDYNHLNLLLTKPKKLISDTKMNYAGLKKPEERAAMIAWLRTLSDSPAALPSEADIAAEAAANAPAEEATPAEGEHTEEGAAAPAEGAEQNEAAPEAGTEAAPEETATSPAEEADKTDAEASHEGSETESTESSTSQSEPVENAAPVDEEAPIEEQTEETAPAPAEEAPAETPAH